MWLLFDYSSLLGMENDSGNAFPFEFQLEVILELEDWIERHCEIWVN